YTWSSTGLLARTSSRNSKSIDRHNPCRIEIFQSKRGNVGQMLIQLSQQTKTAEPTDIRTLVLRGLPLILGDNPTDFYKPGFVSIFTLYKTT
ncbi:hypothetical protein GOODEAATRI_014934, partial [Goodea atripinnis]